MSKTTKVLITTAVTFSLYYYFSRLYFRDFEDWIFQFIKSKTIAYIISYLIMGIPLYAGFLIMHNKESILKNLGLNGNIKKAIIFTFICTLPMLIGNGIGYQIYWEIKLETLTLAVVFSAFIEELFFRGYLFGQGKLILFFSNRLVSHFQYIAF